MLKLIAAPLILLIGASTSQVTATPEELNAFGNIIRKETYICPVAVKSEYLGEIEEGYVVKVTCSSVGDKYFFVNVEYKIILGRNLTAKVIPIR